MGNEVRCISNLGDESEGLEKPLEDNMPSLRNVL